MCFRQEFVRSYLNAWNQHDAAGVVEHFRDDGLYCDVPRQQQLAGEALVDHLTDYFSDDDYRYELIGDVLINNDTLAFQYRVLPMDSRSGAEGWSGAEFIELHGDVARQVSDYYRAPEPRAPRDATAAAVRRYAKSGLSEEAMSDLLEALRQAMEVDRTYLDPELSLPRLAARLGCSVNHLSQAINAGHSMSFFDYVNQFRVTAAAQMLRQQDCRFPAILDVALSVGFNSTSTFYTAFKKATGQTPAKYRRAGSAAAARG
jgi:AraC-like DNA-binding protein